MTVGDKIIEALGAIKTKGWCAGSRQNEDGEVCALGALDTVFYRQRQEVDWYEQAQLALALQVDPEDLTQSDEYNGTTVEELRNARRLLDNPDYPFDPFCSKAWYAESVVAGYNNTHTREEVEAWFEKAAMNVGVTGDSK